MIVSFAAALILFGVVAVGAKRVMPDAVR